MSVKIGSKYLENLIRLGGLVRYLLNGGFQEDPEVLVIDSKDGRCYYNDCDDKKAKSDKRLIVIHENGRNECYPFHSQCIDSLVNDERIPVLN